MAALRRHVLRDGDVSVAILNLGCITQDWRVALDGRLVSVVLGYADPEAYRANPNYLGVIAGRVANRISGAGFTLDGQRHDLPANEGTTHLHGGARGLHARIWEMEPDGARAVQLRLVSPDGDQGYPGRLDLTITISLDGACLSYDMQALSDRPTPVSLAQHCYYNLMGTGDIADHRLQIRADRWCPTDSALIPTGEQRDVAGTAYDFRDARRVGRTDLDRNLVLAIPRESAAVELTAPNGLRLTLWTDQPCLQLYTGAHLTPGAAPLAGQSHAPFAGLCLEPQHYPNAVNTPAFPLALTTPDRPYRQRLKIRIAPVPGG